MDKLYEELFRSMNQFRKLKFSEMFPKCVRQTILCCVRSWIKERTVRLRFRNWLRGRRCLPPAISRTLKGLEERGYVERNVNKNDRRNTYVELTEAGRQLTEEARQTMSDFGKSVMSQVDEADMKRLISYLDNIYHIAEKEIEARKGQGRRKEKGT